EIKERRCCIVKVQPCSTTIRRLLPLYIPIIVLAPFHFEINTLTLVGIHCGTLCLDLISRTIQYDTTDYMVKIIFSHAYLKGNTLKNLSVYVRNYSFSSTEFIQFVQYQPASKIHCRETIMTW